MIDRFKTDIMHMKKPIAENREKIKRYHLSFVSVEKIYQTLVKEKMNVKRVRTTSRIGVDSETKAKNEKYAFMDDIYNTYLFGEVYKSQAKITNDKHKES